MTGKTHDLSVTRLIDAPFDTGWRIATGRLAEWWCPKPRVEIVGQEGRAGRRAALVMHGPNGGTVPQEGIFLEVTPGRSFVFTDALATGWRPRQAFMVGAIALAGVSGQTRYTATARLWTAEAHAAHEATGFIEDRGIVAAGLAAAAAAAGVSPAGCAA